MVMQVNILKNLSYLCFIIFPQWGQFLDHDMTLTPEMEQKCCLRRHQNRPECEPIFIPKRLRARDSVFNFKASRKQKCIPFTRSTPACNVGDGESSFSILTNFVVAAVKVREQFNAITAFLDMSSIYASDNKWQKAMRTTSFHTRRCQCKSRLCNRGRFRKWCPGTLKENSGEKGLPTRKELGTISDFHSGQSGEFKVSIHSVFLLLLNVGNFVG